MKSHRRQRNDEIGTALPRFSAIAETEEGMFEVHLGVDGNPWLIRRVTRDEQRKAVHLTVWTATDRAEPSEHMQQAIARVRSAQREKFQRREGS
jgi:hypothetical protein